MRMDNRKLSTTSLYSSNDRGLAESFKNDPQLAVFCKEWLACRGNATKAYLKLHPTVTPASARVLGARQLAKVNIADLIALMGINNGTYTHLLLQGLYATKTPYSESPDHATRFKYFMALGRLLGVDSGPRGPMAIFNNLNAQVNKE